MFKRPRSRHESASWNVGDQLGGVLVDAFQPGLVNVVVLVGFVAMCVFVGVLNVVMIVADVSVGVGNIAAQAMPAVHGAGRSCDNRFAFTSRPEARPSPSRTAR